jgi:phosphoglycerate dehydrogenase-like enzyme
MKAICFTKENDHFSPEFLTELRNIPNLEINQVTNWQNFSPKEIAALIQDCEIMIASRSPKVPDEIAMNPGKLKYICYLHGTMNKVIGLPIIRSSVRVTNWGNAAGNGLAEASMTLLLSVFKDLPKRILAVRNGSGRNIRSMGSSISQLNIGVYGFGFAGKEFVKLLEPFGATIRIFDPYATDIPKQYNRVDTLKELFTTSQAIVIHAGLTDETIGTVNKELLSLLPDQGIIINTARGAIIDQPAFFDELKTGRLRAGVDVLWPDDLPVDHEARKWENLIWTCHQFLGTAWPSEGAEGVLRGFKVPLENIKAFVNGIPLQFVIDEPRYLRMT